MESLDDCSLHDTVFTFDVSGEIIKTTGTSLKVMGSQYFNAIVEAGVQEAPVFIDRDPLLLRCLLNLARNPANTPCMLLSISEKNLQREAEYYGCPDLIKPVTASLCDKCKSPTDTLHEQWWCLTCQKPSGRAFYPCDTCRSDEATKMFSLCTGCILTNKNAYK